MLPFDAVERLLEPTFAEIASNVLDGLPSTIKRVGDLLIGPSRAIGVGFKKNLGAPHLLAGSLELFDDRRKLFPFLIREANHMNLPHKSLHAQPKRLSAG